MSAASKRAKGNTAPAWVAAYLQAWYPDAEKTPNSRAGRDIENTPGLAIEVKTKAEWRNAWLAQAAGYAVGGLELPVLVWIGQGVGEAAVLRGDAMAVVPLRLLIECAVAAGYVPPPKGAEMISVRCAGCGAEGAGLVQHRAPIPGGQIAPQNGERP